MFDLFSSKDAKEKEELRKNMDRIKEAVEKKEQGQTEIPPPPRQEPEIEQAPQPAEQDVSPRREKPEPIADERPRKPAEEPSPRVDKEPETRPQPQERKTEQIVEEPPQQPRKTEQPKPPAEPAEVDVPEEEIPEPPEITEIEVPDIEKGPLFIRVEKFKQAKRLVHGMRELTSELNSSVGTFRNTLEEDRQETAELEETLKDILDSMYTIKDIVSP